MRLGIDSPGAGTARTPWQEEIERDLESFPGPWGWPTHRGIALGPVRVAVGHSSALVSAGLSVLLARVPGCELMLLRISPCDRASGGVRDARLIFGDSQLLRRLRPRSAEAPDGSPSSAKFVWVTTGDEPEARAAKAAGEIDEHLPLECPEEVLFAVVHQLIAIPSCATKAIGGAPRYGLAPGALRRVREYVRTHLSDRLQGDDLAGIARLSLGHFNRAFRESVGCSPHRYVLQQRVARAAEILRSTEAALADIALDVGFADQSHFCRTFAAMTGETPGACRRRYR